MGTLMATLAAITLIGGVLAALLIDEPVMRELDRLADLDGGER